MTKRRRMSLLGVGVLAAMGITMGTLSAANAGEARTFVVDFSGDGLWAVGEVCADALLPDGKNIYHECNENVRGGAGNNGEEDTVTVPIGADHSDKKIDVYVWGYAHGGKSTDKLKYTIDPDTGTTKKCFLLTNGTQDLAFMEEDCSARDHR